jgi:inosose dehydratase
MTIDLATGPVCWGVDFADAPENPPYRQVLQGAAAAGFRWLELGPLGYLPADVELGLGITAGFVFEPFHERERHPDIQRRALATAERIAALDGRFLLVIPSVTPERARTAGREQAAERLGAGGRDALARGVDAVCAIARVEGLEPVLHPHAGTYVEFADEIEPLLELADLCVDTGHLAYAGIDPVAACDVWGSRIRYVHLKDLDPRQLREDFWSSVRAGAFRPLGGGVVDLRGVLAALTARGYEGWAAIEQDRVAGDGDPVADLRASRHHVEALL